MYKQGNKSKWVLLIFISCGMVLGGFISFKLQNNKYFSWLNYGQEFGFEPFKIYFGVLTFYLGLMLNITIGSIIGVIAGILCFKKFL